MPIDPNPPLRLVYLEIKSKIERDFYLKSTKNIF